MDYQLSMTKKGEHKHIILEADDLVAIFTYVLSKARVKYLYSEVAFITDFGGENLGEAGFCFATLQTAMGHALKLTFT